MRGHTALCAAFVAGFTLLFSSATRAQLPERLKPCSPYPTLADEIREMRAEVAAPQTRVIIEDVKFEGPIHLRAAVLGRLVQSVKASEFYTDSRWIEELQEVGIRGAWQDYGYFLATVVARPTILRVDSKGQHISLSVSVEEGSQYRLGELRFMETSGAAPTTPLSPDELRKLIALNEGDLFNVGVIRRSLQTMTQEYASRGYIDFTASPSTQIEEERGRINLTVELDKEKQFRIGKVEVIGLAPALEIELRSRLLPGEIFNPQRINNFFRVNKSALPAGIRPEQTQIRRNLQDATVDLLFDFWICPKS